MSDLSLRVVGIALALVAGAIHFALSLVNLIPGETTASPAFAAMALGFLGIAALMAFGSGDVLVVAPLYSLSLVFAWAITRGQYPIEAYGIASKIAEIGLSITAIALFRRAKPAPTTPPGPPSG